MAVKLLNFFESAGLDEERKRVGVVRSCIVQHLAVEEDGLFWVLAVGEGSDDGVPHECVGFLDSVEELEGIR